MVSVRLDLETIHEFELVAKVKHQTKSELDGLSIQKVDEALKLWLNLY